MRESVRAILQLHWQASTQRERERERVRRVVGSSVTSNLLEEWNIIIESPTKHEKNENSSLLRRQSIISSLLNWRLVAVDARPRCYSYTKLSRIRSSRPTTPGRKFQSTLRSPWNTSSLLSLIKPLGSGVNCIWKNCISIKRGVWRWSLFKGWRDYSSVICNSKRLTQPIDNTMINANSTVEAALDHGSLLEWYRIPNVAGTIRAVVAFTAVCRLSFRSYSTMSPNQMQIETVIANVA